MNISLYKVIGYEVTDRLSWHHTIICLSVCQFMTLCIVTKQYILQQKCLNK